MLYIYRQGSGLIASHKGNDLPELSLLHIYISVYVSYMPKSLQPAIPVPLFLRVLRRSVETYIDDLVLLKQNLIPGPGVYSAGRIENYRPGA